MSFLSDLVRVPYKFAYFVFNYSLYNHLIFLYLGFKPPLQKQINGLNYILSHLMMNYKAISNV